jgi:ketosteroid isomerase-like protein
MARSCGYREKEFGAMEMRTLTRACTLLIVVVLAGLVPLSASAGDSTKPSTRDVLQREADLYLIDQVEVNFHRATSTHDLNLMMSLWAPGAVFNIDQQTLTGKAQIRHWFATENKAFMPSHHWESDTPTYKIRTSLNGNKATLYFECHYIDPKTSKVMAVAGVDHTLQKINGTWLIVDSAGAPATLSP